MKTASPLHVESRRSHLCSRRAAGGGSSLGCASGGPTLISQQPRCITVLSPLLSEMIPMTDKDMLFLAALACSPGRHTLFDSGLLP